MQDTKMQLTVMKATTKELKTQFKSKDLDINAIERMQVRPESASRLSLAPQTLSHTTVHAAILCEWLSARWQFLDLRTTPLCSTTCQAPLLTPFWGPF